MSNLGHLDDELLSAVLDGEATDDAVAHADSCATCAARLRTLRTAVAALAAAPAAPSPAQRDRAVAAALAALDAVEPEIAHPPAARPDQGERWERGLWSRASAWVLTAAAVLVLFGLGASAFSGGDDDDSSGDATASATTADSAEAQGYSEPGAIDGGDLGTIDDESVRETTAAALAPASEEGDDTTSPGGGTGQTSGAEFDGAARLDSGAAEATPCVDIVRRDYPGLGKLTYTARGRFGGDEVLVHAFRSAEGGPTGHQLFVVTRDDCRLVNFQRL